MDDDRRAGGHGRRETDGVRHRELDALERALRRDLDRLEAALERLEASVRKRVDSLERFHIEETSEDRLRLAEHRAGMDRWNKWAIVATAIGVLVGIAGLVEVILR